MNKRIHAKIALFMAFVMLFTMCLAAPAGSAASGCVGAGCPVCKGQEKITCIGHFTDGKTPCKVCGSANKTALRPCPGACQELRAGNSGGSQPGTQVCGGILTVSGTCKFQKQHVAPCYDKLKDNKTRCRGVYINDAPTCTNSSNHYVYVAPTPTPKPRIAATPTPSPAPIKPMGNYSAPMPFAAPPLQEGECNRTIVRTNASFEPGVTDCPGYVRGGACRTKDLSAPEGSRPSDHKILCTVLYEVPNPLGGRSEFKECQGIYDEEDDDNFMDCTNYTDPNNPDPDKKVHVVGVCEELAAKADTIVKEEYPDSEIKFCSGVLPTKTANQTEGQDTTFCYFDCTEFVSHIVQCDVLLVKARPCKGIILTGKSQTKCTNYKAHPCPALIKVLTDDPKYVPPVRGCTGYMEDAADDETNDGKICIRVREHVVICNAPLLVKNNDGLFDPCQGVIHVDSKNVPGLVTSCSNAKAHYIEPKPSPMPSGWPYPSGSPGPGVSGSPKPSGSPGPSGSPTPCNQTMRGFGTAPEFGTAKCIGTISNEKDRPNVCSNKANHAMACTFFKDISKKERCLGSIPLADSGLPPVCTNEKGHFLELSKCPASIAGNGTELEKGIKSCTGEVVSNDARTCNLRKQHVLLCGESLDGPGKVKCKGAVPTFESEKSRICPNILNHFHSKPLDYNPNTGKLEPDKTPAKDNKPVTQVTLDGEKLDVFLLDSDGKKTEFTQLITKNERGEATLSIMPSLSDGTANLSITAEELKKLQDADIDFVSIDTGMAIARVSLKKLVGEDMEKVAKKMGYTLDDLKYSVVLKELEKPTAVVTKSLKKAKPQTSFYSSSVSITTPNKKKANVSSTVKSGMEVKLFTEEYNKSNKVYQITAKGKATKLKTATGGKTSAPYARAIGTPGNVFVVAR